jgi:crossover junction endodeoxyribonuclease RusA
MSSAGVALKDDYQWQARSQYKKPPLTERLSVTAVFYFGNKRKVDIDNFSKILWDSLTGIVWDDDSQVDEYHIYRAYDKEAPRVELTIHTLPHSSPSPDV